MIIVQVRIPKKVIDNIDDVVKEGYYSSRSEYIREKIRESVRKTK